MDMRYLKGLLPALALGLLLAPASAWSARPAPCPDLLFPGGECALDVGAAVAACCPCDGFPNHGQYVRCVAHAATALRRADCLDRDARRSIRRCAARSTCGKPEGFVTCCVDRPVACEEDGFCARSKDTVPCLSDLDCPPITKCSTKRDAQRCIDRGGLPGTGSCCTACGG
jgi:hypothetical protein